MTDSELIELFFLRDERAIRETEAKYGAMCRRIAQNIFGTREDAEELANDALLALWERIPPDRPDSLRAYLGSIVKRKALTLCRKNMTLKRASFRLEPLEELNECIPSGVNVEELIEAGELARLIEAWLVTLDPEKRALFIRRYWFGSSLAELSAETGKGAKRLSRELFRLRSALKERLKKEGYYP